MRCVQKSRKGFEESVPQCLDLTDTPEAVAEEVWKHYFTAEFTLRYFERLYSGYSRKDKVIRIALGVSSPSTLASFGVWATYPSVQTALLVAGTVFGVIASVTAILNATLGYTELLGKLDADYKLWIKARDAYEELWVRITCGEAVTLEQLESTIKKNAKAGADDLSIPRVEGLMDQCKDDTEISLGIRE
jgi:hypothetical protein